MFALKPRLSFKRALIQLLFTATLIMAGWLILWNLPPSTINHIATTVAKPLCKPMTGINTITQPDSLLGGTFSCVADGRADEAARLALLATAYMSFDKQRLQHDPDENYMELGMRWFPGLMSDEQRAQLSASQIALKNNPNAWQAFCGELNRLGPPAYYPSYIRRYPTNVRFTEFLDPKLKTDFDPKQTWQRILTDELSCKTQAFFDGSSPPTSKASSTRYAQSARA